MVTVEAWSNCAQSGLSEYNQGTILDSHVENREVVKINKNLSQGGWVAVLVLWLSM